MWWSSRWPKLNPNFWTDLEIVLSAWPPAVTNPNLPPLWQWPFPAEDLAHPSNHIVCQNCCCYKKLLQPQARQNPIQQQSCPISGTYLGQLPDAPGLCARLVSNCDKRWVCQPNKKIDVPPLHFNPGKWCSTVCQIVTIAPTYMKVPHQLDLSTFLIWYVQSSSSLFISLASSICPQAVLFCSICQFEFFVVQFLKLL